MISVVSAWGIARLVVCPDDLIVHHFWFAKGTRLNTIQQEQLLIGDPGPSAAWKNLEHPTYQFNYFKFGLSVPVLSTVLDEIILHFPLPAIRGLQTSLKPKAAIFGIFWLGSL